MKEEDSVYTISKASGAAETKAEPQKEVLKSAMKKCCFTRDTSFNDLENEYELGSGSVLTEKVNPVLADPPYSTRSARGQSNCAYDVFSKSNMEGGVRLMGIGMAPGAHGHISCSSLMLYD